MKPANSAKWANLAKRANPRYFTMPYGISCDLSWLCPQRLVAREPARTGILLRFDAADRGEKAWFVLWWTGPIPPHLVEITHLRFFGSSSYWYTYSNFTQQSPPPQGSFLESTHAVSLFPLEPVEANPNLSQLILSPLSGLISKSLKQWQWALSAFKLNTTGSHKKELNFRTEYYCTLTRTHWEKIRLTERPKRNNSVFEWSD